MKKQLLFFSLAFLAIMFSANAQYYYINVPNGGNPKNLNNDPEYPPNGGGLPADWQVILTGTTSTTASWTADQAMPFNFKFNDNNVSNFKVSSSGVLTFDVSAGTAPAYANAELSSPTIPNSSICILGISATTTSDFIVRKVFGTAPNRQLWIQFNSFTEPNLMTGWVYYSIVLEESTNNIYLVDQRTQCVNGTTICSNKTKLSIGVKVDGTNIFPVTGSPNIASTNLNDPTSVDNSYIMYIQGVQPQNEINLNSLNIPKFAKKNDNIQIKGKLSNYGSQNLSSFRVNYTVNSGATRSMLITGLNIPSNGGSYDFTHNIPYSSVTAEMANLKVWTSDPNGMVDPINTNDTLSGLINILDAMVPRRSVHEVFTSSTCPPCKPGNEKLTQILNQRVGKFAVVKYQYFGPGLGDPYFTEECYRRGVYYGQTAANSAGYSVPQLFIDGGWKGNPSGLTTAIFDQFQELPAVVEMTSTIQMTGQKADIKINVKPIATIPAGNYKLHVAIVEKETTKNVKSNGETAFEFVMKKMVPSDAGTTFTFPVANENKTIDLSYTFQGNYKLPVNARTTASVVPTGAGYSGANLTTEHSVEEFYDLHVVAFIQNEDTKEILQSSWSAQDWALGTNEKITNNNNEFNIYPNPTNNYFTIEYKGNNNASFRLLDLNGRELISNEQIGINSEIPCNNLNTGIYIVEMNVNGNVSTKKLSIIK